MKELLSEYFTHYELNFVGIGIRIVIALFIFTVGFAIARWIHKGIRKIMKKKRIEEAVFNFLSSLTNILLKLTVIVFGVSALGIKMTSLIALFGTAGVAVGFALQGTLQNFAGGVLLLLIKPFRIEEFIETQGHSGTVKEIQLFNTILLTVDNKMVVLPNGPLSVSSITNYSRMENRRVDFTFGIGYDDDMKLAVEIVKDIVRNCPYRIVSPESRVEISNLGESSVDITVWVWTKTTHYWDVKFYFPQMIKETFDNNGISIPFPQRDIHIYPDADIEAEFGAN